MLVMGPEVAMTGMSRSGRKGRRGMIHPSVALAGLLAVCGSGADEPVQDRIGEFMEIQDRISQELETCERVLFGSHEKGNSRRDVQRKQEDFDEERRVGESLGLRVLGVPMDGLSMPPFRVHDRAVDMLKGVKLYAKQTKLGVKRVKTAAVN